MKLRKMAKALACAVVCLTGASCGTTHQTAATTKSLVASGGEFYPITTWELSPRADRMTDPHAGLGSIAGAGYTTAAFVRAAEVPDCHRLGLRALVRWDPPGSKANAKWSGLTDEQIEARVKGIIGQTAGDETVIGYFLRDEPGVTEFPALAKAVAAVKRLAPGKLAYINLFPDYATLGAPDLSQLGTATYTEYLERYVQDVRPQFISYDNYRIQFSNDLRDPQTAASYFQNLLEVRRVAAEHHLPFWNIASSNQIRKTTPPPSPANLALQAYTTLAAGAHGLTWYTYYSGGYRYAPVDNHGHPTPTWSYLRMVNDQVKTLGPLLQQMQSTGVFFSSPAPAPGLPTLPGDIVADLKSDAPVMVGEFRQNHLELGARYALVVNLSLERSSKIHLTTKGGGTAVAMVSPVDGSETPVEPDGSIWLPAGQGALLRLP